MASLRQSQVFVSKAHDTISLSTQLNVGTPSCSSSNYLTNSHMIVFHVAPCRLKTAEVNLQIRLLYKLINTMQLTTGLNR